MVALYPIDSSRIKGGVEAVSVNLVSGFVHVKGIELKVLALNSGIKQDQQKIIADHITIHHIAYGKIRSTKFELFFHFRKRLEALINEYNPDVIHIQGNGSQLLLTYKLDKSKVIITQHGILKEELKNKSSLKSKFNFFINITIEFFLMRWIKNYIFISDYNRRLLDKEETAKTALIYNPVNPKFFLVSENEEPVNRLVYIGGIMKRKGLLDLLKAIKILRNQGINFKLDIVGGVIEHEYAELISDFIGNNQLAENVVFHGWLSQDQIIELYRQIHVLVLPSYQETLPVCVSEAMAAGRAVIATKVGGLSEMIGNGQSGFLYEKGGITSLVQILATIFLNTSLYQLVSSNARKCAYQNYEAINIAEQTKSFYKRVIT
jgi:glycosyltransferase involved in cell wall biosynthesis